jgi:hypothetical protein
MYNFVKNQNQTSAKIAGFALLPFLFLLVSLGSIGTILAMEGLSAVRTTAAAQRGRAFDLQKRATAIAAAIPNSSPAIISHPEEDRFRTIRYNLSPLIVQGIPLTSQIEKTAVSCPPITADALTNFGCSAIPPSPHSLVTLNGGLHGSSVVIPETTVALYIRGSVKIQNLTILGSSLTISALGEISIDAVTAPKHPSPPLLLLSQIRQYKLPSIRPAGSTILTAESPQARLFIDSTLFPQRKTPMIGLGI